MASDEKKTKPDSAPKKEPPPKEKKEAMSKDKASPGAEPSKVDAGETAASPAGYSRGEGQKAVTKAYKENWNAIFAKKRANRKKR